MSEKRFENNAEYSLRRWERAISHYPLDRENKRFFAEWHDEESYRVVDVREKAQLCTLLNVDVKKTVDLLNSLAEDIKHLEEYCGDLEADVKRFEKENEKLHHKLKQTKEYLQIKIDECKNHKKMKEIVFGVEQAVGYEKALLGFQKGLKRRLNDE